MVRGQELGARLEHLQRELEQAALERQEFLREQESQHQRWAQWLGTGRDREVRTGCSRFFLVGTRAWSSDWKLSCRQQPPVRRKH